MNIVTLTALQTYRRRHGYRTYKTAANAGRRRAILAAEWPERTFIVVPAPDGSYRWAVAAVLDPHGPVRPNTPVWTWLHGSWQPVDQTLGYCS